MHGYTNCAVLAAAAKTCLYHEAGILSSGGRAKGVDGKIRQVRYVPKSIRSYVESSVDVVPSVAEAARSNVPGSPITQTLNAVLRVILGRLSAEKCVEFVSRLVDGVDLEANSPIYLARQMFLRDKLSKRPAYSSNDRIALCFKSWNLWSSGETRRTLRIRMNGPTAEAWPEPVFSTP
jgi:hypothetical protein